MPSIREQQFGFLEVVTYIAATTAVVGTMLWGWDLNLFVALILGGVAYAILRDLRTLSILRREDTHYPSPVDAIPGRQSLLHPQSGKSLFTANRPRDGANGVDGPFNQTSLAVEQRGTSHEPVECHRA